MTLSMISNFLPFQIFFVKSPFRVFAIEFGSGYAGLGYRLQ